MSDIMNKPPADNAQKYENYKEQFKRLDLSFKHHFYLEATMISYAIMEDRTESILRHSDLYDAYLKSRGKYMVTIDSKIKYIQKAAESKKSILNKYFSDNLLSEILAWKDERNRLIHALLKQNLTTEELEACAQHGADLAKSLRNKATACNRAINRRKNK